MVTSTPEGRSVRRQPTPATGLRLSECEASMENYQAQPYSLRNFVNMVRIKEYQEGSVHIVQEGGSSPPFGIASNGSVHTELQHHDNEGVEYDLDILDHSPGFPRFPSFPPRRGDLINVVSNDEPPTVGETKHERLAREACNIDRFNRRQAKAKAEEEARRIRV